MRASDIREYVERDWESVQSLKESYWAQRKRELSPGEALRIGEDLRRHARAANPDWPSEEERRRDVAHHAELARELSRVPRAAGR